MLLVIQDRSFAGDNELSFISRDMGTIGFLGDRVLVNGQPDAAREVATRPYRLRILNGSNSRIYKLAWSDSRPVTVLGTGGGLLGAPHHYPFVTLAPGQRIDLWVDLSANEPGEELHLISDAYEAGVMANVMGGPDLSAGARIPLLALRVTQRVRTNERLPPRLAEDLQAPPVGRDTPVRRFNLIGAFAINGRQFEGTTVADDEIVHLGRTEIWEFVNDSMMPHPMHVHGLQFAVVDRRQVGGRRSWAGLAAGLVDAGLLDTVLVLPGERVRVALTFTDFEGLYLYHCHNMEHGDNGMMRYYRVRS
ncbi:multicopper oxidase family protein [Salinisphaera sp. SWV1]